MIAALTAPIVPFSKINELGTGMYRGEKVPQAERHTAVCSYIKDAADEARLFLCHSDVPINLS
jgi:hypothetical protein